MNLLKYVKPKKDRVVVMRYLQANGASDEKTLLNAIKEKTDEENSKAVFSLISSGLIRIDDSVISTKIVLTKLGQDWLNDLDLAEEEAACL